MAGKDARLRRQCEQLLADTFEELPMASSGEVGAADGSGEKGVPAKGEGVLREVEDEAVGGVSGDREEAEVESAQAEGIPALKEVVHGVGFDLDGEAPTAGGHVEDQVGVPLGEGVDGSAHPGQFGGVLDVIKVLVGQEQGDGGEPAGANDLRDALRGVDDEEALVGFQKIAVGGDGASGEDAGSHGATLAQCGDDASPILWGAEIAIVGGGGPVRWCWDALAADGPTVHLPPTDSMGLDSPPRGVVQ